MGPQLYVVKKDFAETWDQEVIRRLQCVTSINITKKIIDADRLQLRISRGQDAFFIDEYKDDSGLSLYIYTEKDNLIFEFSNKRKLRTSIEKAVLEITESVVLA